MLYTTLEHTRFYQEAMEEGRQKEAADSVFRQLKKRFGQEVSEETRAQPNFSSPRYEDGGFLSR